MNQIKKQSGQSMVEYLILVALICISTVAVIRVLGQNLRSKFGHIAETIGGNSSGNIEPAEQVTRAQTKKADMSDFFQGSISR